MQTELHFLLIVSQSNIWNCRTQGFLIYCFKEVIKTGGSEGRRSACRYPECRWKDRRTRISEYSYRNFFQELYRKQGQKYAFHAKTQEEFVLWREAFRSELKERLGLRASSACPRQK